MSDFFRYWRDLLWWNWRKSRARWRGRRPPCQAPSDSGRAGETLCEASLPWDQPAKFRRVCPLLVPTPVGLRCSVHAADVRPFWGRAARAYGLLGAAVYLAVTLAVFVGMRSVGYEIGYGQVAWPPAWREFDGIRSKFYLQQGVAALAENRIAAATLALSLAYGLDETNYAAGLTLAQVWQPGQPALSDDIYARLLKSHPQQAEATARAWFRALLLRGDFAQLAVLSAARLKAQPQVSSAWLHAVIVSARQTQDIRQLADLLAAPAFPPELRALLQFERSALTGNAAAVGQMLQQPLAPAMSPYARYYQLDFLIRQGAAVRALELLIQYGKQLPADDRVVLSLEALAASGHRAEVRAECAELLRSNSRPRIYELLAAHLVLHPDSDLLRGVVARFEQAGWANEEQAVPAALALLCAAGVQQDAALLGELRARLKRMTGARYLVLNNAEEVFLPKAGRRSLNAFVTGLPNLPTEAAYAIYEQSKVTAEVAAAGEPPKGPGPGARR